MTSLFVAGVAFTAALIIFIKCSLIFRGLAKQEGL